MVAGEPFSSIKIFTDDEKPADAREFQRTLRDHVILVKDCVKGPMAFDDSGLTTLAPLEFADDIQGKHL